MHVTSFCIQNDSWSCFYKGFLCTVCVSSSNVLVLAMHSCYAWHIVSCLFCFFPWKLRYLSLSPLQVHCLFISLHPLVLVFSTLKVVFKRMFTKCGLIWMMHLCLDVILSNIYFLNYILCYPPYPFVFIPTFSSVWYIDCLFLFSPASTLNSLIFVIYNTCDYFNWSLCCIQCLLIGWVFIFWVCYSLLVMQRTHIWLCVVSLLYDYFFCKTDVFIHPFPLCIYFKYVKPQNLFLIRQWISFFIFSNSVLLFSFSVTHVLKYVA